MCEKDLCIILYHPYLVCMLLWHASFTSFSVFVLIVILNVLSVTCNYLVELSQSNVSHWFNDRPYHFQTDFIVILKLETIIH